MLAIGSKDFRRFWRFSSIFDSYFYHLSLVIEPGVKKKKKCKVHTYCGFRNRCQSSAGYGGVFNFLAESSESGKTYDHKYDPFFFFYERAFKFFRETLWNSQRWHDAGSPPRFKPPAIAPWRTLRNAACFQNFHVRHLPGLAFWFAREPITRVWQLSRGRPASTGPCSQCFCIISRALFVLLRHPDRKTSSKHSPSAFVSASFRP